LRLVVTKTRRDVRPFAYNSCVRLVWVSLIVAGCGFTPRLSGDAAINGSGDDAHVFDDAPGGGSGTGARRKAITIHGPMITGTQTDFPVWIDLADPDIAASARADGTDIFFTATNGTPLDYELQRWNPAAPRLQAWVRVPTLQHNNDAIIFVEYGDLAKAKPTNPSGVFSASFAAVWHLDDALTSTTVVDSTGARDGTASGLAPAAQVPAQLGGGMSFDGQGNAQITFTNPMTGNAAHTISAWVNQTQTTHTSAVILLGTSANTDQSRFFYGRYGNGATIGVGQYNDDWTPNPANDIEGAGWVLIHWVHEGNNKKNHIYRNGAEIAGSPHNATNSPNTTGTMGIIGNAPSPSYGSDNGMDGTIDELRVATVIRDASWIATEYANQSAPNTFYAVGAEQVAP
jgi:MSHA biogenesis protein MshQ